MHAPSPLRLSLLVLICLLPAPAFAQRHPKKQAAAQPKDPAPAGPTKVVFDPLFDYTHLQPSNQEYWEPLSKAKVLLENALELAHKSEGDFQVLSANLQFGGPEPVWALEIFVTGGARPKRVDLQVSTSEPKVVKRIELLALAPSDEAAWAVLSQARVSLEQAIVMSEQSVRGDKPEPIVGDGRVRYAKFVPLPSAPLWLLELMGNDEAKQQLRRYELQVNPLEQHVKRKTLLDRFPGDPPRKGIPTALPDGMWIYDFNVGDGETVQPESKVKVNYRLFLLDGQKIYDTWEKKLPETFELAKAPLKGITEGLPGMRVGGKRKLAIPYALAFGETANQLVPARAMVICDIAIEELVTE